MGEIDYQGTTIKNTFSNYLINQAHAKLTLLHVVIYWNLLYTALLNIHDAILY